MGCPRCMPISCSGWILNRRLGQAAWNVQSCIVKSLRIVLQPHRLAACESRPASLSADFHRGNREKISQENLIHGRACGAYHARKARRWVSCLSQTCHRKLLALLTSPAPSFNPSRPNDRRGSGADPPLVSGELVQSCDGHNRESGDSRSAHEYLFAIVQRVAGHRIVFHAGCVSPLDARKRIALRSLDRAQEPD